MQKITSHILYYTLLLVSFLPLSVLYLISDLLRWIIFDLLGYRKEVISQNLHIAFPEKPEEEINQIAKRYYKHMCDMIVESIKSFSLSKEQVVNRVEIKNLALVQPFIENEQDIIVAFGHSGNWEWFGLSAPAQLPAQLHCLYRKIKNPILNELIRQNRKRFGLNLIGEKDAYRELPEIFSGENPWNLVGFIADHSANPQKCVWVDFFGRKTAFVKGPAMYAKKYAVPILFFSLLKDKRGYYYGAPEVLVDDPSRYSVEEITQKYATRIEQQIKEQPYNWLWSHKRWKHQFEDYESQV